MNTDRTARTGTEVEDGVTHYAGGTANAFARALAYEVGRGAVVHVTTYGATFVEWKVPGARLDIEASADGWFTMHNYPIDYGDEHEVMTLQRAADVARGWLTAHLPHNRSDASGEISDLYARLQAAGRQVHRLIHGEEIESDRICDHELAYTNLRQACVVAGLDPDELGRKHAEWIREGGRVAGKE